MKLLFPEEDLNVSLRACYRAYVIKGLGSSFDERGQRLGDICDLLTREQRRRGQIDASGRDRLGHSEALPLSSRAVDRECV